MAQKIGFVIKNISKGTYYSKQVSFGKVKHSKTLKNACLFYDENDAEETVEMLNDFLADCYSIRTIDLKAIPIN